MSDVYLSAKLQLPIMRRLQSVLQSSDWTGVERLVEELANCWRDGRQVFLCGNGGSAGNAIHLANDFLRHIQDNRIRSSGVSASGEFGGAYLLGERRGLRIDLFCATCGSGGVGAMSNRIVGERQLAQHR